MTPKLTEEQRRAIEGRGGTPVSVVDDATNATYMLLRTEQYEKLKALTEGNEAEAMDPLLADIEPEDWEDASRYGIEKPWAG